MLLTARNEDEARKAASGLKGAEARSAQLDVSDAASIERFASALQRDGTRVGALVNNAGVSLDGFDAEVARRTLETNFHGAMRLTDALASQLATDARAVMVSSGLAALSSYSPAIRAGFASPTLTRDALLELVDSFVASVAAGTHTRDGWPSSAYRVSKAALESLTRLYAAEHPTWRVNAVDPGWVQTRMGGAAAPRTLDEGARGIAWAATLPADGPTGGVFFDQRPVQR